jgi:hypothetical protein
MLPVHLQSKIIPDYLLFAGRDVQEEGKVIDQYA